MHTDRPSLVPSVSTPNPKITRPQEGGDAAAGSACRAGVPPSVDPGLSYGFVSWEDVPRRYQLYMPQQVYAQPDRPLPLIVDFHGMPILEEMRCVRSRPYDRSIDSIRTPSPHVRDNPLLPNPLNPSHPRPNTSEAIASGLDYVAEEKGFIVVRPHALGSLFNAGSCCNPFVDDVGFVRKLVQTLKRLYCIDPRRIYAVGLSGGGMMIYKVACDAADVFVSWRTRAAWVIINDKRSDHQSTRYGGRRRPIGRSLTYIHILSLTNATGRRRLDWRGAAR